MKSWQFSDQNPLKNTNSILLRLSASINLQPSIALSIKTIYQYIINQHNGNRLNQNSSRRASLFPHTSPHTSTHTSGYLHHFVEESPYSKVKEHRQPGNASSTATDTYYFTRSFTCSFICPPWLWMWIRPRQRPRTHVIIHSAFRPGFKGCVFISSPIRCCTNTVRSFNNRFTGQT